MITVFYDGKCGLCRSEINHYIKIAPTSIFNWVDITTNPDDFTKLGFAVNEGLKALHVLDKTGKTHIGVEGFIVIWNSLPRWWVLAKIVDLPVIKNFVKIIYNIFASWRFKKLGYNRCAL